MSDSLATDRAGGADSPTPTEAADLDAGRRIRVERVGRMPDLIIASHSLARVIAVVAAVSIVIGSVFWIIEAGNRLDVPDVIRPAWFRTVQFGLAVAGIISAAVEFAYLAYFGLTGRIWRRWRTVTFVFALLASAWTILWLLDRFVLDEFFLD